MKKASIIKSKFIRNTRPDVFKHKQPLNTKLWETYDDAIKLKISRDITLIHNEEIVVIFYLSDDYWWLITNIRFILFENNKIYYIEKKDLLSIEGTFIKYIQELGNFKKVLKADTLTKYHKVIEDTKKEKENKLILINKENHLFYLKIDQETDEIILDMLRFIFS